MQSRSPTPTSPGRRCPALDQTSPLRSVSSRLANHTFAQLGRAATCASQPSHRAAAAASSQPDSSCLDRNHAGALQAALAILLKEARTPLHPRTSPLGKPDTSARPASRTAPAAPPKASSSRIVRSVSASERDTYGTGRAGVRLGAAGEDPTEDPPAAPRRAGTRGHGHGRFPHPLGPTGLFAVDTVTLTHSSRSARPTPQSLCCGRWRGLPGRRRRGSGGARCRSCRLCCGRTVRTQRWSGSWSHKGGGATRCVVTLLGVSSAVTQT